MNWETLTQIDRRHIWHPYTAMPNTQLVYAVARAEGCSIELADGKRLGDGTSSWWAALHGYNHPRLNAAAAAQLAKMSHVMFGGLTHEPAVRLTQLLLELLRGIVALLRHQRQCTLLGYHCKSGSLCGSISGALSWRA